MTLIRAQQYDPHDPPEDDYPRCLRARRGNHWYNFGHWGHLAFYAGPPGTMKSTTLKHLVAAGLSGKECFQQTFDLGDRMIIYADGQQPEDIFQKSMKDIMTLAGKDHDDRFLGMNYTDMTQPIDRYNDVLRLVHKHRKDIGMLILDCADDFTNPNDELTSREFIENWKKLGKHLKMITLGVTHLTDKQDKSARKKMYGHLGTIWEKQASWGFYTDQQGKYFGLLKGKFRYPPIPNMWFTRQGNLLLPEPYFPY